MKDFEIFEIGVRKVLIKGLGKRFYQNGYPIGIMAREFIARGVEVSWYHVADELIKHGWEWEKILLILKDELLDGTGYDEKMVTSFIFSSYERQREMIFKFLFSSNQEAATIHFRNRVNAFYGK